MFVFTSASLFNKLSDLIFITLNCYHLLFEDEFYDTKSSHLQTLLALYKDPMCTLRTMTKTFLGARSRYLRVLKSKPYLRAVFRERFDFSGLPLG